MTKVMTDLRLGMCAEEFDLNIMMFRWLKWKGRFGSGERGSIL